MSISPLKNKKPSPSRIVEVELVGHLTKTQLIDALAGADSLLSSTSEPIALLVDCSQMTAYDTDAREHFVEWNRVARSRVQRLAVMTTRTMWHLVVSGMALASGQSMKAFNDRDAAESWLLAG